MCLLYNWSMLFFILNALIQKQAQRDVWDGSKIICIVLLWERAIHTVVLLREVQTRFFFCQSPVAAFPGGRRTYEGWHDGKQTSWIMNVPFGVSFTFDIIGEIPSWPRKNGNYGKKLLPTRIQKWTRNFCALFVKLNVDNQNMPNTSYSRGIEETLWSVHISISPALRSVASRAAALEFGMGDMWFKSAVM